MWLKVTEGHHYYPSSLVIKKVNKLLTKQKGCAGSPCPLSRKSVMMAALQGDQGLVRLIWMSVGDIMWLSFSFPNTSSQAFTLSWGILKTWPVEREKE